MLKQGVSCILSDYDSSKTSDQMLMYFERVKLDMMKKSGYWCCFLFAEKYVLMYLAYI